ncbi:MAG: FliH/SctL family protein [Gemmatimonadota bacterium]
MTYSSDTPRGAHRAGPESPPPSLWSLDELASLRPTSIHSGPGDGTDSSPREIDLAYARGYDEGRRAGEAGEAARLRTALQALVEGASVIQEEGAAWLNNVDENIAAVAVSVARQILDREISIDAEAALALVRRALLEFPIEQSLIIRLNPANLGTIAQGVGARADDRAEGGAFGDRADVQWVSDPRIVPGGCVIEGRERVIDGRVDSALERMYRRLSLVDA